MAKSKPVKRPPDCLWACHRCELIGDAHGATRHLEATGHAVAEIGAEDSASVRALWAKEGKDPRTGATFTPLNFVNFDPRLVAHF